MSNAQQYQDTGAGKEFLSLLKYHRYEKQKKKKVTVTRNISILPPFFTSLHLNWCRLTTEKTESNPSFWIRSATFIRSLGCKQGDVAWIFPTISTSKEKQRDSYETIHVFSNTTKCGMSGYHTIKKKPKRKTFLTFIYSMLYLFF